MSSTSTETGFVPPEFAPPHRVMVLAAATRGWYDASAEERQRHLPLFTRLLRRWEEQGARLLASFDDDYFMVGEPGSPDHSIYVLYEVDSVDIVVAMMQEVREEVDGARLDRCFRFEAKIGRPLFLADDF